MIRKNTIIVVDDEENIRDICRIYLEKAGFNVLTAGGAIGARAILETTARVDVLVTDVSMPGTSGPELVMQIRPHYPNLKVLYITGHPDWDPLLNLHINEWGCHLLRKPFLPAQLVDAVTSMFQAPAHSVSISLRAPRDECSFFVAPPPGSDRPRYQVRDDLFRIRVQTDTLREESNAHWQELQDTWLGFIHISGRARRIGSASEWEGLFAQELS